MTEERDQCVRDMSGWMEHGETLSQAICAMRLSASTCKQQLAAMTEERDEQCAGKMAFFNGMNDMREQRTALERQLATVTKEREEARDMAACLLLFGPTFPADVAWAEMQIAKMKHEKGLP